MDFNGKNTNEQKQKMFLAMDLLKLIYTMAEQGEDFSLVLRNYNDLIEEYNLPMSKVRWISNTEFEFLAIAGCRGVNQK